MKFKFNSYVGIDNFRRYIQKDPEVKFCAFAYADCNSSNKVFTVIKLGFSVQISLDEPKKGICNVKC